MTQHTRFRCKYHEYSIVLFLKPVRVLITLMTYSLSYSQCDAYR